jgi:hypothetical protein
MSLRRCWLRENEQIEDQLRSGNYRFSLMSRVMLKTGDEADLWSARDGLVLKALALVLGEHLPVSRRCTHLKGNGGAKYAVRQVSDHLPDNHYVLRTDVKSYDASIDHLLLLNRLAVHIRDRRVLNLIGQYLRRTSERGGSFWDYEKGISRCTSGDGSGGPRAGFGQVYTVMGSAKKRPPRGGLFEILSVGSSGVRQCWLRTTTICHEANYRKSKKGGHPAGGLRNTRCEIPCETQRIREKQSGSGRYRRIDTIGRNRAAGEQRGVINEPEGKLKFRGV